MEMSWSKCHDHKKMWLWSMSKHMEERPQFIGTALGITKLIGEMS